MFTLKSFLISSNFFLIKQILVTIIIITALAMRINASYIQQKQYLPVKHKLASYRNTVANINVTDSNHNSNNNNNYNNNNNSNNTIKHSFNNHYLLYNRNHNHNNMSKLIRAITTSNSTIFDTAVAPVSETAPVPSLTRMAHFNSFLLGSLSTVSTSTSSSVASVASTTATATATAPSLSLNSLQGLRWRKRHRKRHSSWYDYTNYNENSTILEWSNPCEGFYDANAKQSITRLTKKEQLQFYYKLKRTASNDYKTLMSSPLKEIDIDNIQIWSLHNYTYKFLPKLKMNSGIALNRWYRNMQTYVGSFGYLRRVQRKWERTTSRTESTTALELTVLLKSARNVLCELETTVNNTQSFKAKRHHKPLPQITREQMEKRLKLRTKQLLERYPNILQEADSIDLRFVKYYYYEYLKNMWRLLKEFLKRKDHRSRHKFQRINRLQYNEIEKLGRRERFRLKLNLKYKRRHLHHKNKFHNLT